MMLKRLAMIGFKSFADKTEFEFDRGITCIVGPNGCGKSNVVDAIKWVLGEQSAKSLRGSQMQDVIFNGSGTRKPAGMAQVDLTFDNNDRKLAVDTEEVIITRRLFRDGTSEYLVNNQDVRLKDIRELFLDTGVGFDAYSIIEQGRIEVLLQANPAERRVLFDEAAGISKYRARVKEAMRKLERTDQNLLRVNDILEELSRRLRSVKVQAGRAKSWQEYTVRLKELRSLYVLNEYRKYSAELQQRGKDLEIAKEHSLAIHSQIAAHDADAAQIDASIVQLDSQISGVESNLQIAASTVNTQRERISQTFRRMQESQETLSSARGQARWSKAQQQVLADKVVAHRGQLEQLDTESAQVKARIEAMQAEDRNAAEAIADITHRVESAKSQMLDLVRQISHLRSEQAQGEDRARSLTSQRTRLADRLADARAQMESVQERCQQIEQSLGELRQQQEEVSFRLKNIQAQTEALDQRKSKLTAELGALKERRSGLISRLELLEELNRRYEGISPAVKTLLAERDRDNRGQGIGDRGQKERQGLGTEETTGIGDRGLGAGDGRLKAEGGSNQRAGSPIIGVLGELIEADLADAGWIEGALAGLDQVVLVESREAVLSQTDKYTSLSGKVQILPLDTGDLAGTEQISLDGQPGFVAWAVSKVRFDSRYGTAAAWALGRVGLVETLADAIRLAEKAPRGYRFVSRDGQIVEAGGTLTLGTGKGGTGLISRRSELRQIHVELRKLDMDINERQETLKATSAEMEGLLEQSDDLRGNLQELQKVGVQNESQLRSERQNAQRLSQEEQLLEGEMGMLDEQVRQAASRAAAAAEKVKGLESRQIEVQQTINISQEELKQAQVGRAAIQERLTEVRVAAGKLAEKRAGVVAALHQTQHDLDRAQQEYAKSVSAVEMAGQRLIEAERTLLDAQQHLAHGCQAKEGLQRTALGIRKERSEQRLELEKLQEALKALRQKYEVQDSRVRELELQTSQLQLRIETLVQRTLEELQINLNDRVTDNGLRVTGTEADRGTGTGEQGLESQRQDTGATPGPFAGVQTVERVMPEIPAEIDWAAVEVEIAELRGKIERLGNVNLDAIGEQSELEGRLTFLTTQQADLAESKKQLEELILKLNEESKRRFVEAFELVRTHFQELFRKLFGGGKADLVLTNPEDVLESGVDIMARPPGKELQSISLLSGGEKALTAMSLIMAVFRSHPSPFTIMDEADAALDEANNERYTRLIKEFLQYSQFIVITHSKRTMSIGDVMYGVTMQEAGVSKRVAVRFQDESAARMEKVA